MATFDASKLSKLDWGVAGAGIVAFFSLFFAWEGYSSTYGSVSASGWDTSYGWLGALLILASGVYLVLQRSQVNLPKMPVGSAVLLLGAATLGTLIIALRWATLPRGHGGVAVGVVSYSYSYGPRFGMILALLAGIVQVGCAFALFRASGEALPWVTTGQTASSAPSPTPPPMPPSTDDTTPPTV